jgi:hypothetical protein
MSHRRQPPLVNRCRATGPAAARWLNALIGLGSHGLIDAWLGKIVSATEHPAQDVSVLVVGNVGNVTHKDLRKNSLALPKAIRFDDQPF